MDETGSKTFASFFSSLLLFPLFPQNFGGLRGPAVPGSFILELPLNFVLALLALIMAHFLVSTLKILTVFMPSTPSPSDTAHTHYFSRRSFSAPQQLSKVLRLQVAQSTLEVVTGRGVFARAGLDAGSKVLLETVLPLFTSLPDQSQVADLGCGWGALGCFLARRNPQTSVFMCDVNAHAAWLAKHNIERNRLSNARVWCGDGLSAARSAQFDRVITNPPIRTGNRTLEVLFADAHRCLKPEGELWLVIRTAQGAKSWQKRLQTLFGNCETVALKSGYRVLHCKKQD